MAERSVELYRTIRLIRRFEERAVELVRSGDIASGIHPCVGQEGAAVGCLAALRPEDIVLSNHRGHGHLLAKGCDPGRVLAEMLGRVTGIARGRGGSFHPSDMAGGVYGSTGTVGHGAAIATGVAWAVAKSGRVAVSIFGDGAVSQGALLESFNLAALWRAPVVFVCENNLYATTLPVRTAVAGTVVGRGEAFGIPSVSIEGMDAEAVLATVGPAVHRARTGGGPSLVELRTYRYYGHHTFELKTRLRYRDDAEIAAWRAKDPLDIQAARVPAAVRAAIDAEVETVLDGAVRYALDSPRADPADALAHLYATPVPTRAGAYDA